MKKLKPFLVKKELETEPLSQENKEFEVSEYISYSFDISKTEASDSGVIIEGYASTRDRDRQKDVVLPEAFAKSLPEYMDNPVVLFNHKRDMPIGKTLSADIDAKGLFVRCEITDPTYATKAQKGELRAFSWVGQANKAYEGKSDKGEKTRFITDASLYEISVVTIPANQKSLFRVAKSLDDFIEKETTTPTMTIEEIQAAIAKALAENSTAQVVALEAMKKELEASKAELVTAKAEAEKNFVEGQRKGTQSSAPAIIVKNNFHSVEDISKAVEAGRTEEVQERFSDHTNLKTEEKQALFELTKDMLMDGLKDEKGNTYVSKITSGTATTSVFNHLTPTLWSPQLEKTLRRKSVLLPTLLENTDLLGVAGDTVYIPTLPDTTGIFGPLTEATDMTINQISADTSVTLVPTEYGGALGFTRKVLDRLGYDGMASAMDQMAYDTAKYMNTQVANLFSGLETATSQVWPGSHVTLNTIVSTDKFSDATLIACGLAMRGIDAESYPNGNYQLYISPKQWSDFLTSSQVRTDINYARPQYVVTGEAQGNAYVGTWHNIDIYVTNYIGYVANTGPVNVYKSLLLSPRWAVIGWKRKLSMVVDPTLYDFGRRRQVGITADYQIKLLHSDRAFVVETA